MRERTKHRIKAFCFGLALIAFIWLLIPSPLCLIPRFCGGLSIVFSKYLGFGTVQTSELYINIPGFLALAGLSTWVIGTVVGIVVVIAAVIMPEKYELQHCPNCNVETQQFKSGSKFKEGFKNKWDTPLKVREAVRVSYQYVCESCRQKIDVPNPNYNPDIDVKEPVNRSHPKKS